MAPVDLAYAAGIMDGEGYIGITEYAIGGGRKSPQFRCRVTVCMCDSEVPEWLAATFGGTVHVYEGRKPGQRAQSHWVLQNRRAAEFCALVAPYMRTKHRQAELLSAFYVDWRFDFTRRGGKGPQITTSEILGRRSYVVAIQRLNRRGVPAQEVIWS